MHYVQAKSILSSHNGINIYRGCSHGCIYCDSRSRCYDFKHAFEDIEIKKNAPELLEKALKSKRNKCIIGTGSMCDPYLHLEEELKLTRRCLEIIDRYEFGVAILTKSTRILRDMDLLISINKKAKAVVQMTLTTYDDNLCRIIEPNVSTTRERFDALCAFHDAGIPTVVWITPILPFINDTEENIRGILNYCIEAGVVGIISFGLGLTLRDGDREYYYESLDKYFPGLKEKYISTYGNAYVLESPRAREMNELLIKICTDHGIMFNSEEVLADIAELPEKYHQQSLFDMDEYN